MLEDIRLDIEKLIALYEAVKAENAVLRGELRKSSEAAENYKGKVSELEQQISTLTLAGAFTGGGDNSAAKEKIDKLIKEIGKCISLLEG